LGRSWASPLAHRHGRPGTSPRQVVPVVPPPCHMTRARVEGTAFHQCPRARGNTIDWLHVYVVGSGVVFPLCRQTLDGSPCATCPRPRWETPRLRRRYSTFTRPAGPSRSGTSPRLAPRRGRGGAVEHERLGGVAMKAMCRSRSATSDSGNLAIAVLPYEFVPTVTYVSILMHTVAWMCEKTDAAWIA
jgi:hypothetical protein